MSHLILQPACLYLEHMKSLKLYVPAGVPQEVHHQFEVLWVANVLGHCGEVVPVEQELS